MRRFLPLAALGLLASSLLAQTKPARSSAEETQRLLAANAAQVTAIAGAYTLHRFHMPDLHANLQWDLAADLLSLRAQYPLQQDHFDTLWVIGKNQEWHAEPAPGKNTPPAWNVQTSARGAYPVPRAILDSTFGLNFIRAGLTGYTAPAPDNTAKRTLSQRRDPATGHIFLLDTVTGEVTESMEYELDLSDGVRVLHAVGLSHGYGPKPAKIYEAVYTDHVKSNGLWLPKTIDEKYFLPKKDGSLETVDATLLSFETLEANPTFKAESFTFVAPDNAATRPVGAAAP
jgi:hypothetical protein